VVVAAVVPVVAVNAFEEVVAVIMVRSLSFY